MATVPQWPRPASFDDEVNEPLVLVDRFKQHYLSICHHTADNPTATAPASYVMDAMFQANKVITLLANQIDMGAGKQRAEVKASTNTAEVVAQDAPSMERETRAPEGGTLLGHALGPGTLEVAGKMVGTIHDFNWGDGDSEDDRDWEDDGSSERDSEDEFYEYGDFEDEEEATENNHGHERHSGQEDGLQVGLNNGLDTAAGGTAENGPGGTIHDMNWGVEESGEDPDWQDTDSSDHDSEDDYYEYGDFEDEDGETPNSAGGEQQAESQVNLDHPVDEAAEATEETQNPVVSNISDAGWGVEDSEGDQDWEDNGSSDHDSEDDYYEYGDFGDDDDPENGDQHEYHDGQPNGIDHQLENDAAAAAAGGHDQEETHPTPADPASWRDVYDWIPGLTTQETPVQDSEMPSQLPADPEALPFKIRWGCVHPPYKGWHSRGMNHDDIINQVEDALAKSSILGLREIHLHSAQPYNLSGDLVLHPTTHEDRACLLNHLKDWVPLLQQGHFARIPRVYYPEVRTKTEYPVETKPLPTPTLDTSPDLPGLRIRWRNNVAPYKARNSQGFIYVDIWRHLYSALRDSGHPELPGMQIPFMNINEHTGDIDVFLDSHNDRDFLYDTESSWVPLLEQGQHARIMFFYNPKEQQPQPSPTTVQHTETIPSSSATQPSPPLKIHWDTDPPYRGREDIEQTRQNLLCQLLEFFDPLPDATRKFDITIDPETGDVDFSLGDDDYKYAMGTIPQWLCLLERSEVARIPGIYNPLRRAKSRAKNAKKSRLSLLVGVQADEADGSEKGGSKDGSMNGSPSSQSHSERQLERRRTKRRQRRWERKVQRNAEVLAC